MTRNGLSLLVALASAALALAEEPGSPSAAPAPSSTPAPARSVRISFVPPPLEGSISLGIYDHEGKLVRVLVQEGAVDEFDVGADALTAKWDGKNDRDEDLPAGKYHARGYMIGHLKVDDVGPAQNAPGDIAGADHVQMRLVSNPLSKEAKTTVDLGVTSEDDQIFLKTADGLPLFSVIEAPQLVRVGITKEGEKAVNVWADGGSAVEQIRVANVDQMMAFDCGEIELK
jgi:hypothetical protein